MSTLTQDELNNIRERTWAAFAASPEFVPQACADALKLLTHIAALEAEIERLRLALGEASRQVDFMPEEVADFLRGDTDDVEW